MKKSIKDVVLYIASYVEEMLQIVKPQKVLYFAVDGVAPRAKMNQQRSRRYSSAYETYLEVIEQEAMDEKFDRSVSAFFSFPQENPAVPFELLTFHFSFCSKSSIRTAFPPELNLWTK